MAGKPLHVVTDDDRLEPSEPMTITDAAEKGDRRDLLVALRTRVAKAVESEDTPPRDLAALSRRLIDISKEIEAFDARVEGESSHAQAVDAPFDAEAI